MTPSYRSLRSLAVSLLAVSTMAACGGDDQSVEPATVASDTTVVIDTVASETTAAPTDVTDTVADTSVSTSASTTTAASVALQAGATTTMAKTGAPATTTKPVVSAPVPTLPPATAPPATVPPATQPPAPATVSASCTGASNRTVRASLGDFINLAVSSENGLEQEFHVHGYDITLGGMSVSFRFTADTVGSFIVESHDTKLVACTLVVS